MIGEDKIKGRINELEYILDSNEELFHSLSRYNYYENETKRNILFQCHNSIESQLEALYYVLGKQYVYRHK